MGIRRSAVVLNDMIRGNLARVDDEAHNGSIARSRIVPNVVRLVAAARSAQVPVIWIRVERRADRADIVDTATDRPVGWHLPTPVTRESWMAEQVTELPIEASDHVVLKPRLDPFQGTDLDLRLRALGADTIVLGGYSTNMGVESCARTAHDLGYNVVIVEDCCFDVNERLHHLTLEEILPAFGRVVSLDSAIAEW